MPREVIIDGLAMDDGDCTEDYEGPYLFTDPDGCMQDAAARPFPYRLTEQVTIRHLITASGRTPRTSSDSELTTRMRVVEAN